ncbi:Transposon Ty3-I Gag-Pol polyprotein [Araneus ventricosus]|uniref:Transposon Ty3-I Gag-Pol polyprotein n=1 Tax=Araneus ventricosus TaxID=182803 RepID=A0A4Y2K4Y7_ARAVE|nr:Transposon Ty3-I Gag-Pol polyprotein [Araneus ventricosus]
MYPIQSILDLTSEWAILFFYIDLVKSFHQIPIASEDIRKTAICTPFDLFEIHRMHFGLSNSASTFQRSIDEVTLDLKVVYAFIDDILIASRNSEEYTAHLRALFGKIDFYGLTIKPSKCTLGVHSLNVLGFQVSGEGLSPPPDRVEVFKFPRSNTIAQLLRFLGMYNFYRRLFPKGFHILVLLIKFLEGRANKKKSSRPSKNPESPLEWTEEAEISFTAAKTALADATILKHPIPGVTLSVWTDASNVAIGNTLMQLSNGNWEPIALLFLKLPKSQQNWSTYDRELLAIYTSMKILRHMLEGREFIIYSDQKPTLIFAFKQKPERCSPRKLRHLDYISQFSADSRCVVGRDNKVADALSRVEIDTITKPPTLDYKKFAQTQLNDTEFLSFFEPDSSIKLVKQYFLLEDVFYIVIYHSKSLDHSSLKT